MDGNQNRDEMVADLHAMKDVGIGSVLFLEVNIGVPAGPVDFMSDEWQDNVVPVHQPHRPRLARTSTVGANEHQVTFRRGRSVHRSARDGLTPLRSHP